MKMIVTAIPRYLVTNFAFMLFFSFLLNQKQESGFQQVGGRVTRNNCFLFIASRALLQSHAEFNKLLQNNFLIYMLFLFVL